MSMKVDRNEHNVVEIRGFKFDDASATQLRQSFREAAAVVIRETTFTPESLIRLTRLLGEPYIHHLEAYRHKDYPEIVEVCASKTALPDDHPNANDMTGYTLYHADLSFLDRPARGTLLLGVTIPPEGGETGFIDVSLVYKALPEKKKRQISGLKGAHTFGKAYEESKADKRQFFKTGEIANERFEESVEQPLVFRHPENGLPVLNLSPLFLTHLVGMSKEASDQLLGELQEFALNDRFVHLHEWQQGDLVIWDNLQALHSGRGHKRKYVRYLLRTQLKGEVNLTDYMI